MFVINIIRAMYYTRQLCKFEERETHHTRSKNEGLKDWFNRMFETEEARAMRLATREAKLKASNERLALLLLDECVGSEDNMNRACDLIKQMGLVEDYE